MTLSVLFAVLLTASPGAAAAGPEGVVAAFVAAFNARDPARTAALYEVNAEFMPPDGPPAKGRAAITAAYEAYFKEVRVLDVLSTQFAVSGSLAYVTGRLTMSTRTPQQGADIVAGSYLIVLRLVAGEWRIAHHMFNFPLRPDYVG